MTQAGATFVEFTAQTRMSGVDLDRTAVRKGAGGQIVAWARSLGGSAPKPDLSALGWSESVD